MPITLPPPQLLEIAGVDALAFAHSQFCNDVIALPVGHWQWNAWLSPQGRVRFFFMLLRDGEVLRLLLRGGDAQVMRAALMRFVFRAKVSLRVIADLQAIGCDERAAILLLDALPDSDALAYHDGNIGLRLPGPSRRCLVLSASGSKAVAATSSDEAVNRWRLEDIRAGLPELPPVLEDQSLPQWMGLAHLRAISVGKGCYPGQEVMARLHFKGGNKRGLYRIEFCCAALPAPATPLFSVHSPSVETGFIVMTAWSAHGCAEALATLAHSAAADPLCTELAALTVIKVISGFT